MLFLWVLLLILYQIWRLIISADNAIRTCPTRGHTVDVIRNKSVYVGGGEGRGGRRVKEEVGG